MASARSSNAMSSAPSGSETAPAATLTPQHPHMMMMEVDPSRADHIKREEEPVAAYQLLVSSAHDFSAQALGVASVTTVDIVDEELIPPTSSRHTRLPFPAVPSTPQHTQRPATPVAISAPTQSHNTQYTSQDVHSVVNSATSRTPSSALLTGTFEHPRQLETSVSSSFSPSLTQHGLTHHPIRRPRTSPRVFQSSTDLAAHYGIPQVLPPAPRTTSSRYLPAPATTQPSAPAPKQSPSPLADFQTLSQNYLNMLSKKPTDNTSVATTVTTSSVTTTTPAQTMSTAPAASELDAPVISTGDLTQSQLQNIADVLAASPEFRDMDSFMTSPLMPGLEDDFTSPLETPYADFLTTPLLDDSFTSPLLEMDMWADEPLFPPLDDSYLKQQEGQHQQQQLEQPKATAAASLDASELYTISPGTPALDSFDPTAFSRSLNDTSVAPRSSVPPSSSTAIARRSKATGIRKGVTPDQLLDEEAPTQPRKYATPSATSRKEVPAVFARKRSRSAAFGLDEEDQLGADDLLPPNPTEKDLIEAKRRQNTVAARRSRRRKLEQFQRMEASRNEERQLKEQWQERANVLLKLVRTMGVNYPDFPPDQQLYADA